MSVSQLKIRRPVSIESEKTVLGALLLDCTLFEKISEQLCCNDFSSVVHGSIFETMGSLFSKRKVFDIPMILDVMSHQPADNLELHQSLESLLLSLANECPSVANIKAHADIIREKSVQRQLITVAKEIAVGAMNPKNGMKEILDDAERKVMLLADSYDVDICPAQTHLVYFLRELAEEVATSDLTVEYLSQCIVETSKAFVSTMEHISENHATV